MAPAQITHPVDVASVERNRLHVEYLLRAVAPDGDLDIGFLYGALHFAETVDDLAVDRQQQVAGLEQSGCGRARHQAVDAEHLAALSVVLLEALYPLVGESQLRALASDCTLNSASNEYSGRPVADIVDHLR